MRLITGAPPRIKAVAELAVSISRHGKLDELRQVWQSWVLQPLLLGLGLGLGITELLPLLLAKKNQVLMQVLAFSGQTVSLE